MTTVALDHPAWFSDQSRCLRQLAAPDPAPLTHLAWTLYMGTAGLIAGLPFNSRPATDSCFPVASWDCWPGFECRCSEVRSGPGWMPSRSARWTRFEVSMGVALPGGGCGGFVCGLDGLGFSTAARSLGLWVVLPGPWFDRLAWSPACDGSEFARLPCLRIRDYFPRGFVALPLLG